METKIFKFEESEITFLMSKDNNVMVNATEMAKAFDKKVDNFTRIDSTQEFIKACLRFANIEENKTPKSVFSDMKSELDLIISRQKSGTFMHRVLALKFAAWLNPNFEVWVYATIEKLLFGKHVEREQSLERTLLLKNELHELSLKEDKTGADFERYLKIDAELKREKAIRANLTRETVTEMQSLFEEGGDL